MTLIINERACPGCGQIEDHDTGCFEGTVDPDEIYTAPEIPERDTKGHLLWLRANGTRA